jgi:hypothetical protein
VTPRQKKAIIETGLKHPFWAKFLKPYLESEIADCQRLYRHVPPSDLRTLQLNHEHLEALLNYPGEQLEAANNELEMERDAKESVD